MYDPARHLTLRPDPWDADTARSAIAEIVADALGAVGPDGFWPPHPRDEDSAEREASVYMGAAGMVWALDYLRRNGATAQGRDFTPLLEGILEVNREAVARFGDLGFYASLLVGDLGVLLVKMRLAPSTDTADAIHRRIQDNLALPPLELMWGTPGSMLAALFMAEMTREERFIALYRRQAAHLLAALVDSEVGPVWPQFFGTYEQRYLGAVHGFAGNAAALLMGWTRLTDDERERTLAAIGRTVPATAHESEDGVNWPAFAIAGVKPDQVQHCHGAPGMVTVFADMPTATPELDRLLRRGGDLIWNAGPLAKGSNLCHGTGGNGYAFLKLHRRFGDSLWLERARAFAMTAIAQCREARAEHGRGRYSLWTGDIGLAIYLWDCLRAGPGFGLKTEARFPTVDVF